MTHTPPSPSWEVRLPAAPPPQAPTGRAASPLAAERQESPFASQPDTEFPAPASGTNRLFGCSAIRLFAFSLILLPLLLSACVRVTPPVPPPALPPASSPHPTPPPGVLAPPRPPPLPSTPSKPTTKPSNHQTVKPSNPPGFEAAFALQLHLDQANYSPGGLDGHWGAKSRHALTAWQLAHHLPPTGDPTDPTLPAALTATNNLFATHTVTPADHAALTAPASGWREKSKRDRLGCTTLSELLSERYHLYEATLRHLNPDAPSWPNPPPGTILTVPAGIPSPTSQKTRLPPLSRLEIRLADHTLRAYAKDGTLAAQFPCSIAADKAKRPVDRTLHVRVWAENPEYTFDPALYADDPAAATIGKRLRIPPGPNNPVGVAWIGLDLPGYGIHGTPAPEDITKTESHGCFRLTNWDALRLVHAVHKDLPVKILP